MIRRTAGKTRGQSLFLSIASTRSRTFGHLFPVLHKRCPVFSPLEQD